MILYYFKLLVVSVLLSLYVYCFGITSVEDFIKYGYFGTNCLIVTNSEEEVQNIPQPGENNISMAVLYIDFVIHSNCDHANI